MEEEEEITEESGTREKLIEEIIGLWEDDGGIDWEKAKETAWKVERAEYSVEEKECEEDKLLIDKFPENDEGLCTLCMLNPCLCVLTKLEMKIEAKQ